MTNTLTIVIPCYNEAARMQPASFTSFLNKNRNIHFLFVDDGSKDNTGEIISEIQKRGAGQVRSLILDQNCGKAEAVRQGILAALEAPVDFVGFWDADLATPLDEIIRFVTLITHNKPRSIIFGSRVKRMGATIRRHWYRHYAGRVIATFISILLNLPTYDTQCGAKLFTREVAEKIFADPFFSPWLFDVELVARVIGTYGRREAAEMIYELPLTQWRDVQASKIALSYLPKIPLELINIYYHYREQLRQP